MNQPTGRQLQLVEVTDETFKELYAETGAAIRDFLYLYFDIASDCLPHGDFSRADRGSTDPLRYVDIDFRYRYQFRSPAEIDLLHRGAAVSVIARLAEIDDLDEASGSTYLADLSGPPGANTDKALAKELTELRRAFLDGRIVDEPSIHRALQAAFSTPADFRDQLPQVLSAVVLPTFERAGRQTASSSSRRQARPGHTQRHGSAE